MDLTAPWYVNPAGGVQQAQAGDDGNFITPGTWSDGGDDAEFTPWAQATEADFSQLTPEQQQSVNGELGWKGLLQGVDYINPWSWGSGQGSLNGLATGEWMNPQTGAKEASVMVEGGYRVPKSFADANGLNVIGNVAADPIYGNPDILEEYGWAVPLMIATAGQAGWIDALNAGISGGSAAAGSAAAGASPGAPAWTSLAADLGGADAAMTAGLSAADIAGITGAGGLVSGSRSILDQIVGTLKIPGLGGGKASPLSQLFNVGTGLYGLYQGQQQQKLAQQLLERSDPFANQRGIYAAMLQNLMANPGSIVDMPGYRAGERAITRKLASQGYAGSGNMFTALADYGGSEFDREVARLATLAGAGATPGANSAAVLSANSGGLATQLSALNRIGYGLAGGY